MARRSYKDSSRKRQKKKATQRVGKLPVSSRGIAVTAVLVIALGFTLASLFVPAWVDWGDGNTEVTLWSLCTDTVFGFKQCVELRNDNRFQSLASAGVVSLAMIVIALLIGTCTLIVSMLFALGKPVGLFCFDRRRNAALTFFGTFAFTAVMYGCWISYASIYFSTSAYKNSTPKQDAGVSFYLAFIASVFGTLATIGAGVNWAIDWRNFEDRVFKKAAITATLMVVCLFFSLLALGTRGWVVSSDQGQFLTDGARNVTGRVEVGLFQLCLINGPTYSCTPLYNSNSKAVRDSPLRVDLDNLLNAGTTTAAFTVAGIACAVPSVILSTIHALREDIGFLCFARHRNGYFAFLFNLLATVAMVLAWITYSSIAYSSTSYKENGRLKAGYSLGMSIVASLFSALATIVGCWARRNPDWYGSEYEDPVPATAATRRAGRPTATDATDDEAGGLTDLSLAATDVTDDDDDDEPVKKASKASGKGSKPAAGGKKPSAASSKSGSSKPASTKGKSASTKGKSASTKGKSASTKGKSKPASKGKSKPASKGKPAPKSAAKGKKKPASKAKSSKKGSTSASAASTAASS